MSNIDKAIKNIEKGLNKIQHDIVEEGLRLVKDKTPVRSGLLKNSWSAEHKEFGQQSSINNPQRYAKYVENGSPTTRPAKMAAQTVQQLKIEAGKIIKRIMD